MGVKKISIKTFGLMHQVLSMSWFSWFVIALFVVQALWVAWTFDWIMFDEQFHFGIINIYTQHWWPVIYDQPLAYDQYRDFAGEGSKLYHFLMSFPLRVIALFTSDQVIQLQLLRIINIGMGAYGLWWFLRLFRLLNIQRAYANTALLIFVLLPIVPWIGGAVNYDNFIFMLTPISFYVFIKILKKLPVINKADMANFIGLGMAASLAKFTFIPLLVFMVFVIIARMVILKKSAIQLSFSKSKKINLLSASFLTFFLGLLTILFFQTYVVNFVKYGTPRPECQKTLGVDRCLNNPVIQRNERLIRERQSAERNNVLEYSPTWLQTMNRTIFYSSRVDGKDTKPLPIISMTFVVLFMVGLVASMIWLIRERRRYRQHMYLLILLAMIILYAAVMFFEHYALYKKYAAPLAIQGRYLLIVLPIVIVLFVQSTAKVLEKRQKVYVGLVCSVLLLIGASQGGGVLTHVVRAEPEVYWNDPNIQDINMSAKYILQHVIKE